jgi:hypothetical protein
MVIKVPMLPAKELNPNWKGHWAQRARAAKTLREATYLCALMQSKNTRPGYKKAEVSVKFLVRDWRYIRDADNALASLKPAIDGCVDAGIIQDDSPDCLSYRLPFMWVKDREQAPAIILEFKEVE